MFSGTDVPPGKHEAGGAVPIPSRGPKLLEGEGPFASDCYTQTSFDHYEALTGNGLAVDIVSTQSDFNNYKLLILPALYLVDVSLAERIRSFVKKGGHVVGTYLTGYVDQSNRCHLGGFPGGGLRELFGLWNEELDSMHDETEVVVEGEVSGKAIDLVERIHAEGADTIAQAGSEFYKGHPLITRNEFNSGAAYYLAARLDLPTLTNFYQQTILSLGLRPSIRLDLPKGIVYRERKSATGTLGFLFNYTKHTHSIDLGDIEWTSFSSPKIKYRDTLELPPYASLTLRL